MINKLNALISSIVITLTLVAPQLSYGSEENVEDASYSSSPFGLFPPEVREIIVREAAVKQALDYKGPDNLALVNRECLSFIKRELKQVNGPVWKVLQGVIDEKDNTTYQTFLNGKLVYRPTPGSDEGKIELKISDFPNPFKGTFGLSQCGSTINFLTITTDPSTFFKIDKEHPKLNILFAPYFLIKKHITSSAKPFEGIMTDWDKTAAPIGIFWRWGGDDNLTQFEYLVTSSSSVISTKNLFENWLARAPVRAVAMCAAVSRSVRTIPEDVSCFMFIL